MIYVSSSCVKEKYITHSVERLAKLGFKNIELSGGTQPQENMVELLLELKGRYQINFLLHNYFPPPKIPFVINLAALDNETAHATIEHLKNSINITKELNADKFGFHAGFLINIPINQMGKEISKQGLFDETSAMNLFCSRFNQLLENTNGVELYLENNVLSETNFKNFNNINPFFFTDWNSYKVLSERIKFKPLLDIAHLKVSCHTLKLNFQNELKQFCSISDYIHVSDNDGKTDANQALERDSEMYNLLSKNNIKGKIFTLEVYTGEDDIIKSYNNLQDLIK